MTGSFSDLSSIDDESYYREPFVKPSRSSQSTDYDDILLDKEYLKRETFENIQGGNVPDSILTLLAATIGTGIIMIPNSMAASGTLWSTLQMIFCAFTSYYSLMTLVRCANHLRVFSYQDIALQTFGNWGRQSVNIASFFANWGATILYLKLTVQLFAVSNTAFFGVTLPAWLINPENNKLLPVFIATVFVLPLSIPRELKSLRYFCAINMAFVILFCYVVLVEGFDYQPLWESVKTTSLFTLAGFSTTFPSAVFAYMSHTNILDVFKELKEPSVHKMQKIIKYTILFVLGTYVLVGIIGYTTFSSNINILSNTQTSNGIILIAYGYTLDGMKRLYPALVLLSIATMCFSVIISQPFNIKPAKDSLANFFKRSSDISRNRSSESDLLHLVYVVFTLYSGVLVVIYSDSVQTIMNILGSTFYSLICFIFPSMYYLKIYKDEISKKDKIMHWGMIILNSIFAIWSTYQNIDGAVN